MCGSVLLAVVFGLHRVTAILPKVSPRNCYIASAIIPSWVFVSKCVILCPRNANVLSFARLASGLPLLILLLDMFQLFAQVLDLRIVIVENLSSMLVQSRM